MITTTYAEFRNRTKKYFDAVEKGETIEVQRRGKPVAILSPPHPRPMDRWKRANPLSIPGLSLSKEILADRERSS